MISSKQNTLIKEIRSLKDKKFRDKLGVFVLEGIKPVREGVDFNLPIREIVLTEKNYGDFADCNYKIEVVSEEVFKSISEEKTPQGVLAVVFKGENKLISPKGACLLLDGVSDPNNVGAIIRTAVASGYSDIYLTNACADAYSQKSVRCSMSGVFRANIMRADLQDILSVINLPIVVADMNGQNVFDIQKVCNFFIRLFFILIFLYCSLSLSSWDCNCFASLNHFVVFYPISHFAVSSSFFFSLYEFLFLLSLNLYGLYGILLCVCVLVA